MNTLLSILVFWLSANFGLPANYDHPRVAFVSPSEMVSIQYRGLAMVQPEGALFRPNARTVVSLYDTRTRTIYLRKGWTGATAAELSMLVHEMVHHLQMRAGLRYACPEEREKLAYEAQDRWLRLFGGSLEREFETDPFTLLSVTNCL